MENGNELKKRSWKFKLDMAIQTAIFFTGFVLLANYIFVDDLHIISSIVQGVIFGLIMGFIYPYLIPNRKKKDS